MKLDLVISGDISAISDEICKIKEHPERYEVVFNRIDKRSLRANRYAWELIGKLAAKLHVDKNTVYREIIRDVNGISRTALVKEEDAAEVKADWESNGIGWIVEEFPCDIEGYVDFTLYKGSSKFTPTEMNEFIELIVAECKQFRIETLTPYELEQIKSAYR